MKKKEKEKLVCIYKSETKSMDLAPPSPTPFLLGKWEVGLNLQPNFQKGERGLIGPQLFEGRC